MFELDEEKMPQVTLKLLALKVPFVRVRVRWDAPSISKLLPSWTAPPTPVMETGRFI